MPLAIAWTVCRVITEHVLITQRDADFSGDIRHIVRIVDDKRASAGELSNFAQKSWPQSLFLRRKVTVVDSDGITA